MPCHAMPLSCALVLLCRKFIDVLPLDNDWSAGYKAKTRAMMAIRRDIRQDLLGYAAKFGKK